jgi:hypothetical protein
VSFKHGAAIAVNTEVVNGADAPRRARVSSKIVVVVCVGFMLRVAAAIVMPDQSAILGDSIAYRAAGHSLWITGQLGTPYHMPLYPAFIAVFGPGWPQLLIDITLSSAMIWLIYRLADVVFSDERTGLLAAAITAVYPNFIFFSIVGLTETLFMTLLVAGYLNWFRNSNLRGDVCAVLGILTRPIIDPLAPILVVCFTFLNRISGARITAGLILKRLAVYAATYCVLMAPWWLHNYEAYGRFVRLNLGGGLALFSGNNPSNQTGGLDTDLDESAAPFYKIEDPFARDQAMRDAAISYIKKDPVRFIEQGLLKLLRFWRPWPYTAKYASPVYIIISLCSFVPVAGMAVVFLVVGARTQLVRAAPMILFILYLTALHMVFPGSIRYRLPLEPFLIVLGAEGAMILATERFRFGKGTALLTQSSS